MIHSPRPSSLGANAAVLPLPRIKTSEAVAAHLLGEFVAGRLRPGDRIDLFEVAAALGVSRQPVREALVLLERDGTVRMPFHRGAFLGDIDAASVREAFTLYAVLSGITARVAHGALDDAGRDAVGSAAASARAARSAPEFEVQAREYRRLVNRWGAGAQLRALLRTFTGLVVAVSTAAIAADLAEEQRLLTAEFEALLGGEAAAAAETAIAHVRATGERGIRVLVARGAIAPEEPVVAAGDRAAVLDSVLAALTEDAR